MCFFVNDTQQNGRVGEKKREEIDRDQIKSFCPQSHETKKLKKGITLVRKILTSRFTIGLR